LYIFFSDRACRHQWHVVIWIFWRINKLYFKLLTIDCNFSTHITKVEWTRDHLSLFTSIHCCKFDSCLCSSVYIVYFLITSSAVIIGIEELQPSQLFVNRVVCVFIIFTILINNLRCAIMELFLYLLITIKYFFKVLLGHIWVTALMHYSFDCCFWSSIHQPELDQH